MPHAVTVDGVTIRWHDLGGTGPDLLLLHATGFHGLVLEPLAAHLRSTFHCWSLDLRGHGDSSQPPLEDFAWDQFALDVRAVVDQLGLVRPLAFGHSLGGASLLLTELGWPGTFAGLYLYEPALYLPDQVVDDGSAWVEMALRRRSVFPSREEARRNFSTKPPMNAFDPAVLDRYVSHGLVDRDDGTVRLACPPEMEAAIFGAFTRTDLHARLWQLRCPVVLSRGARVPGTGPSGPTMADRLPGARLEAVADLDHYGPLCSPARLARSVEQALGPN